MAVDTAWIVEQAKAIGFDLCGVVRAKEFSELGQFTEWLERGYGGEMDYLEDPRRREPSLVMQELRSVIVCALNYNSGYPYSVEAAVSNTAGDEEPRGWISRYAWGDDYHEVLWTKLNVLVAALKEKVPQPFAARAYADTGPVAERVFAKHAGLGWLAKNTLLLNEELGSWLFLGVIFTSLELSPLRGSADTPSPDLCGNCRQCLDACPTGALVEPYVLDARRCISYLTIELRGSIPEEFREPMGWQVYGCDICQDVCPFNRAAPASSLEAFLPRLILPGPRNQSETAIPQGIKPKDASTQMSELKLRPLTPNESLLAPKLEWLAGMREAEFRETFRGSAVKRTKWAGLVRNACIALGNSGTRMGTANFDRTVALLERLLGSENSAIAESARWALARIKLKA